LAAVEGLVVVMAIALMEGLGFEGLNCSSSPPPTASNLLGWMAGEMDWLGIENLL